MLTEPLYLLKLHAVPQLMSIYKQSWINWILSISSEWGGLEQPGCRADQERRQVSDSITSVHNYLCLFDFCCRRPLASAYLAVKSWMARETHAEISSVNVSWHEMFHQTFQQPTDAIISKWSGYKHYCINTVWQTEGDKSHEIKVSVNKRAGNTLIVII